VTSYLICQLKDVSPLLATGAHVDDNGECDVLGMEGESHKNYPLDDVLMLPLSFKVIDVAHSCVSTARRTLWIATLPMRWLYKAR
jgi:hypothetical protein